MKTNNMRGGEYEILKLMKEIGTSAVPFTSHLQFQAEYENRRTMLTSKNLEFSDRINSIK